MNLQTLMLAPLDSLERWAEWLGIPLPRPSRDYKYRLICRCLRAMEKKKPQNRSPGAKKAS